MLYKLICRESECIVRIEHYFDPRPWRFLVKKCVVPILVPPQVMVGHQEPLYAKLQLIKPRITCTKRSEDCFFNLVSLSKPALRASALGKPCDPLLNFGPSCKSYHAVNAKGLRSPACDYLR